MLIRPRVIHDDDDASRLRAATHNHQIEIVHRLDFILKEHAVRNIELFVVDDQNRGVVQVLRDDDEASRLRAATYHS